MAGGEGDPFYDAEIGVETELDFMKLERKSQEPHRMFYERLSAHVREHLTGPNKKVGSISSGESGDQMTLSMQNLVVKIFLHKISPKLADIVRKEYGPVMKSGKLLCELVPEICRNIDNLMKKEANNVSLVREDAASINNVTEDMSGLSSDELDEREDEAVNTINGTFTDCTVRTVQGVDHRERRVPVLPDEFENSPIVNFISQESSFLHSFVLTDLTDPQIKSLQGRVRKIGQKRKIRKEKSPALQAIVKNKIFVMTVDEGAELNIISADLVRRAEIPITPTRENANAADGGGLKVVGQTMFELVVYGLFEGNRVEINLGHVLVVENLEADVLMGEPGKKDNDVCTKPKEEKIMINRNGRQYVTSYYKPGGGRHHYAAVKMTKTEKLQEGDFIKVEVPEEMKNCEEVLITPRRGDKEWFIPMMRRVLNGKVALKNVTENTVTVRRGKVIGEIRSCRKAEPSKIRRTNLTETEKKPLWDINKINKVVNEDNDGFKYYNFAEERENESFLSQVQIDPDNQLSQDWKDKFRELLAGYDKVINPAPGKYNAAFGETTTKINFATVPPPSDKVYIPNYSKEMMEELAKKMDTLIRWGVLVRAEDLGITVEHVSPSMLVPKGDGDGFRFVTDFSRLNTFIGKFPSVSPTIQDAKDAIAKKRYAVHLDLSNYFYQGGVLKEDAQYLGVVHPYQGLFVYSVSPQGLKNSSEQSYERLAVIFGDLVRQDRMTRHADGLHVLGDTVEELYENLGLVLERCKLANLTLKPSKVIVAPVNSVLFGWKLMGHRWFPTEHTISALAGCEKPSTVKQLRSFIGAFKQFADLVPGYAKLLHPLEMVAAGKESRDLVQWNKELEELFRQAQKATTKLEAITTPRPDDKLHTYSDYSQETRAVGGKMIIERKTENGTKFFLAGHYSVILDKFKQKWLPCEGEAAGIKLTLNNFRSWILDNNGVTTHHTDNQPSVQAWKRLKRGAYSSSSRIASFLSELSQMSVELEYTPGREMKTSDFASRNPPVCSSPTTCQVCRFAREIQAVGDHSSKIRKITIDDVTAGRSILPLSQKAAWTDVQHRDSVHTKLLHLMRIGQSPNQHKTNGDNTKLKQLYSLFLKGELTHDKDNTIIVKTKNGAYGGYALSIPYTMFPGLVHTLHIRLGHPSKTQLSQLVQRYFYSPGHQRIINEVTDSCFQCCSMKPLPGVLIKDTTTRVETCGTNFSADVMERSGQKVLLVRESLTSFTWARLVEDQRADTLETCLLSMILPFISDAGATVRTDGATAFQSLAARADSDLKRHNIVIEVGRLHNENKNPQAENGIKEFEKETLRYDPELKFLKEIHIINILKAMNTRIRHQGKSSQEMLLRREMLENKKINIIDKQLANKQQENRRQQSKYQQTFQAKHKKETIEQDLQVGDFVFIRKQLSKHKARELHVIHDSKKIGDKKFLVVRKADNQLRGKTYLMLQQELMKAPINNKPLDMKDAVVEDNIVKQQNKESAVSRPTRQAARKARELFEKVLRVTDGVDLLTPADHLYGAQQDTELARHRSVGDLIEVNMPVSVRQTSNPVSFHATKPATTINGKLRNVNPCIFNPYGEDIFVDLDGDDNIDETDDETAGEPFGIQHIQQAMQHNIGARQPEEEEPQPEPVLQESFNEIDESTNKDYETTNNDVSLTLRADHSQRLDSLLEAGIIPPAIPPKSLRLPVPEIPPKRSRAKSDKGSLYTNYADLHHGRIRKGSTQN